MKIGVAGEVCSFELMKKIKAHLIEQGHEVVDMGMQDAERSMTFYEIAPKMAQAIQEGEVERGVMMCGTGMGVCMASNKYKDVYAGLAESATTARLHYTINRANVICMGAWIVGERVAFDIVDAYLSAEIGKGFNETRRKVQADGFKKIQEIEDKNFR